jgi:hypothetical protein
VNPILPYEQLLADKVQQVPVPDMADSIWAAIEQELDKGTPGDDGGNQPSSPKGGGGSPLPGLYAYITGGIVIGAILLTYVLTNTKKETTTNEPSPTIIIPQESIQRDIDKDSTAALPVKNNPASVFYNDVRKPDSNTVLSPFQQTSPLFDSLLNQQAGRIQNDSAGNKINSLVNTVTKPDSIAIDKGVPPKKSKGVKGITDDDYKIRTEKKDSTPR